MALRTLHLFAGAGGGLLADLILGHEPVAAVEIDPYCCKILRERSSDGWFPGLRVYERDVRMLSASDLPGSVDCISAGFPCQDISTAGRGAGIRGERSGLFFEIIRLAREMGPRFLFLENSPAIATRGLGVVLGSLAEIGFDAVWTTLAAADVGAPHRRERWWCLAYANGVRSSQGEREGLEGLGRERAHDRLPATKCGGSQRPQQRGPVADASERGRESTGQELQPGRDAVGSGRGTVADADGQRLEGERGGGLLDREREAQRDDVDGRGGAGQVGQSGGPGSSEREGATGERAYAATAGTGWWATEPDLGRVAHGVASRVDRLKALGNGQVPLQAAAAWEILWRMMTREIEAA